MTKTADPIVTTEDGALRGSSFPGGFRFLGITYGAPTGGDGRFRPPQPVSAWTGVRDATKLGPAAPQLDRRTGGPRTSWSSAQMPGTEIMAKMMESPGIEQSEDCLNLNVYTPGLRPSEARPVMVWLHGGGFNAGTANAPVYDGATLAKTTGVVVVGVNHRLGALGYADFSAVGGGGEGGCVANVATLDQVAALTWVRREIERFGGDPERVMIFGESGGGWKVSTLLATPMAEGLFQRASIQSGAGVTMVTGDRAAEVAQRFLENLGAGSVSDLIDRPADEILAAQHATELGLGPRIIPNMVDGFAPVVGDDTLPRDPFADDAPECSSRVPVIIGYNRTEMTLFSDLDTLLADDQRASAIARRILGPVVGAELLARYRSRYPDAAPARALAYLTTGVTMSPFVDDILRSRLSAVAPTFSYRFDQETSVMDGLLMSPHFLEVPYVFGNLEVAQELIGRPDEAASALAAKMGSTWAAFAETGVPDAGPHGLGEWPSYDRDRHFTMLASAEPTAEDGVIAGDVEIVGAAVAGLRARRVTGGAAAGG